MTDNEKFIMKKHNVKELKEILNSDLFSDDMVVLVKTYQGLGDIELVRLIHDPDDEGDICVLDMND